MSGCCRSPPCRPMSRRSARRAARPASDDDDDENDENAENGVTEMTERSPLKQRDASEAQGGSARDRLARARRRANEPARDDGDAEGAARATAAAPAAASDGEDEREDEDEEGGGQEGGESRDTAVAVPVSRARSPGRCRRVRTRPHQRRMSLCVKRCVVSVTVAERVLHARAKLRSRC